MNDPFVNNQGLNDALERYLDGVMPPEECAAFERHLAGDASLQAECRRHAALRAGLSRLYPLDAAPIEIPATSLAKVGPSRRLVWLGTAAAVLLAATAFIYLANWNGARSLFSNPMPMRHIAKTDFRRDLRVEYAKQVAAGFKPEEVCTTQEAFAAWTLKAFGHALKPATGAAAGGIAMTGWSKADMFSGYTGLLLATVDGTPVLVAMDSTAKDSVVPADDAVNAPHLFRKKVNGVWLVEVTPLDTPRVLGVIEAAN